jgi:hypothetical protein
MPTRRDLLLSALAGGGLIVGAPRAGGAKKAERVSRRPPTEERRIIAPSVEAEIRRVKRLIADPELSWLFENCYPNTLDTTVTLGALDGKPDTFVVTGDIAALWLRDSSAQVWPYLRLAAGGGRSGIAAPFSRPHSSARALHSHRPIRKRVPE